MEKQTNRKHVFRGVQNEKDILKKISLLFVLFGLGWFESVWVMLSHPHGPQSFKYELLFYMCFVNVFHSVMCQCVRQEILLRAVCTAGPSWALLWAGRTAGKDSTVLSVTNSPKVCLVWPTVILSFQVKAVHICPAILAQTCVFLIVSWRFYQPTNQGRRVDWEKKPELSLGSYEILEKQTVRNGFVISSLLRSTLIVIYCIVPCYWFCSVTHQYLYVVVISHKGKDIL